MDYSKKKALLQQIKDYNLKVKLRSLAEKSEAKRPFRHLPKQFSKGILIGHIAIVPKKFNETRFVYVVANMINAQILFDTIQLKQTAILVAHYLAENKTIPKNILDLDMEFGSKMFEITNFRRFLVGAKKDKDDSTEFIYENKIRETKRILDYKKHHIQEIFDTTFRNAQSN